ELGGENLVLELIGKALAAVLGGRGHGRVFAGIGLGIVVDIGHVGFHAFDVACFFAFAGLLVFFRLGLFVLAFALFGRLVGTLGLIGLAVIGVVFVGSIAVVEFALGNQVEIAQHGFY